MRLLLAALALWAAAGTACAVIGNGATLTDAQQVIAAMKIGPSDQKAADLKGADLQIVGALDRADRSYRVGEPVTLSVQVNKAAYVAVLRVMPNGATTLVFPNSRQATARVPADTPLRIPEAGAPLETARRRHCSREYQDILNIQVAAPCGCLLPIDGGPQLGSRWPWL
jgi:Lhr-like helicase